MGTTTGFAAALASAWLASAALPLATKRTRSTLSWLLPLAGIALMLGVGSQWTPWQRLAFASAGMMLLLKAAILGQRATPLPFKGALAFCTIWPGMNPEPFAEKRAAPDDAAQGFSGSLLRTYAGLATVLGLALLAPSVPTQVLGWLGIASLLLAIHLGFAGVLQAIVRLSGWQVGPLFRSPLKSQTLSEFWTSRWNLAFVEMDRLLFLRPLTRLVGGRGAVLGVFLVSGVLHELAISFPAGRGWGGPLCYFAIQGVLVLVERRLKLHSSLWTWAVVLLPLPLLFHEAFRGVLIVPLFLNLHALLWSHPAAWYWNVGLWLLAAAQFSVLLASFQVPGKLGWHEDLPKLRPFNRKLMWTYAVTIVSTVIGFGIMTLALHDELLRGDRAAMSVALFIAGFWTLRLIVDAVYYEHKDWPKGAVFVVGHAMLNSLFMLLVAGYGGIVLWHALS